MSALAASSSDGSAPAPPGRLWQNLWVRLAVALAFADASIVVLALPQIIDRFHGVSIQSSAWVIVAYNLALILTSVAIVVLARRLPPTPTLIAGLAIFGLASIGCGLSNSLTALIVLRCVQGVGGALVLAASLPLFAAAARPGDSALNGWAAAAAVGAAVGPAAGGILTQLFDWRSIFLAQAPVAAMAAAAVLVLRHHQPALPEAEADRPPSSLDPLSANGALLLLSAGIIGALFLAVIELIVGWLLSPIAAAGIVSTIPLATAVGERLVRGRSAIVLGAVGAILLVAGLLILAQLPHRELGWVVVALVLCGTGIGLAFPGLTAVALESGGSTTARAAKTVAFREAGLVLGLLVLAPILQTQVQRVQKIAQDPASGPFRTAVVDVVAAPLPLLTKGVLAVELPAALKNSGKVDVPRIDPIFDQLSQGASPSDRAALTQLRTKLDRIIQDTVTPAFRRPYHYAALLAVLVLPLLALRLLTLRRRGGPDPPPLPS